MEEQNVCFMAGLKTDKRNSVFQYPLKDHTPPVTRDTRLGFLHGKGSNQQS